MWWILRVRCSKSGKKYELIIIVLDAFYDYLKTEVIFLDDFHLYWWICNFKLRSHYRICKSSPPICKCNFASVKRKLVPHIVLYIWLDLCFTLGFFAPHKVVCEQQGFKNKSFSFTENKIQSCPVIKVKKKTLYT